MNLLWSAVVLFLARKHWGKTGNYHVHFPRWEKVRKWNQTTSISHLGIKTQGILSSPRSVFDNTAIFDFFFFFFYVLIVDWISSVNVFVSNFGEGCLGVECASTFLCYYVQKMFLKIVWTFTYELRQMKSFIDLGHRPNDFDKRGDVPFSKFSHQ